MKRLLALALFATSPALADESTLTLKPGPGSDTTAAACAACHSLDYIHTNAGFMSPDTWKAEVNKMRATFGAPIDQAVADEILTYLITTYGAPAKP